MSKLQIHFHPKFLELFRQEELDDMMKKCDMYTEDDDGRVDFILMMGQNLNVQMKCGRGNKPLIIENLDSIDAQDSQMSKRTFLKYLSQFESDEIIIDNEIDYARN